jgi:hypothetical protein
MVPNPRRVAAGRRNGIKSGIVRRRRSGLLCQVCELYAADTAHQTGLLCSRCAADNGADGREGAQLPAAAREVAARRVRREARIAEGVCIDCPEDADAGVRCRVCAAKAAARARAYYHRHAERIRAEKLAHYYARKAAA